MPLPKLILPKRYNDSKGIASASIVVETMDTLRMAGEETLGFGKSNRKSNIICELFNAVAIQHIYSLVHFNEITLWFAAAAIIFTPIVWNVIGRVQYNQRLITRKFGLSAENGTWFSAAVIFFISSCRDMLFKIAMKHQPRVAAFEDIGVQTVGYMFICVGTMLVLMATYRLGIQGTYLADYFGILKESRITDFPFDILEHPMYVGATLNFVGYALCQCSAAGILLSILAYFVYMISAQYFEGPFTATIYAARESKISRKSL